MTRRGGQLPWGARSDRAYYGGRRGGGPRAIAIGLIAAGVIAIGVFLLLRACGGESCDKAYCPSGQDLPTPEGYERVTGIYEYQAADDLPTDLQIQVQLPLEQPTTDARNLSFYSFVADTGGWSVLAPAVLDAEGRSASATLNTAPAIITVMRRVLPAGRVVAYVGHNALLHPEAVSRVTVLHTRDFAPASDGTISGDLSDLASTGVPTDGSVAH
jgi:hypothetical protein